MSTPQAAAHARATAALVEAADPDALARRADEDPDFYEAFAQALFEVALAGPAPPHPAWLPAVRSVVTRERLAAERFPPRIERVSGGVLRSTPLRSAADYARLAGAHAEFASYFSSLST